MKTLQLAALALLSAFSLQPSALLGQGSLTPPGAPAPTMKTLAQVEPRTPIGSAPFTISQPGSYYLTTNLTVSTGDAITIATNGVTLDLNGFTIRSTAASATGYGILINRVNDITIANGHIRGGVTNNGNGVFNGSGFRHGICYSDMWPVNVLVTRVSVSGCLSTGIHLNDRSTVVEFCTVRMVGDVGIYASTVRQSCAIDCGGSAIDGDQVSDCRGESSYGTGIYATTALNCHGSSSTGTGVRATTAQNCYGYSSSSYGVYAIRTATGCYGESISGTGLYAQNAATCTGYRTGGRAIQATIANGCYAADGTNSITHKYNMP